MAQGALPYKYEEEKKTSGMTAIAGLPVYLDLASVLGLGDHIRTHLQVKGQGWTDEQIVTSLILLNLAGGDCVDDLKILEKDEGFCKVLRRVETKGLTRPQRRALERRWRKECHRSVPSPSAIFRYLEAFHDPLEEKKREKGIAFIPTPNQHLSGLIKVNRDFIASVHKRRPLVPELITKGHYAPPSLGIETDELLSRAIARQFGVAGAAVVRVPNGSSGARAGLQGIRSGARNSIIPGDVILAVDGKDIDSVARLQARLDDFKAGDTVKLTVWRDGERIELAATLQSGEEGRL